MRVVALIVALSVALCTAQFNSTEKQWILDQLNGPYARGEDVLSTYLTNFTWDTTLETSAQAWANNGQFQHSPCVTASTPTCAENLWQATGYPALQSIPDWVNEKLQWTCTSSGQLPSGILHYTALVWESSTQPKIGCGVKWSGRSALVVCQMTGTPIPNTGPASPPARPFPTNKCPATFRTMPNAPGTVMGAFVSPCLALVLALTFVASMLA